MKFYIVYVRCENRSISTDKQSCTSEIINACFAFPARKHSYVPNANNGVTASLECLLSIFPTIPTDQNLSTRLLTSRARLIFIIIMPAERHLVVPVYAGNQATPACFLKPH
jgi:hypothetical protein